MNKLFLIISSCEIVYILQYLLQKSKICLLCQNIFSLFKLNPSRNKYLQIKLYYERYRYREIKYREIKIWSYLMTNLMTAQP